MRLTPVLLLMAALVVTVFAADQAEKSDLRADTAAQSVTGDLEGERRQVGYSGGQDGAAKREIHPTLDDTRGRMLRRNGKRGRDEKKDNENQRDDDEKDKTMKRHGGKRRGVKRENGKKSVNGSKSKTERKRIMSPKKAKKKDEEEKSQKEKKRKNQNQGKMKKTSARRRIKKVNQDRMTEETTKKMMEMRRRRRRRKQQKGSLSKDSKGRGGEEENTENQKRRKKIGEEGENRRKIKIARTEGDKKRRNMKDKKKEENERPEIQTRKQTSPSVLRNEFVSGLLIDVCGTSSVTLDYGESVIIFSNNDRTKQKCTVKIKGPAGTTLFVTFPQYNLNRKGCGKENVQLKAKGNKVKLCAKDAPSGDLFERNSLRLTYTRRKLGAKQYSGGFVCVISSLGDPPTTTPAVTTPAVTTPAVTTPAVTTPAVTTPAVTTPAVTTPAATTPAATTPAATTPAVTTPAVTTTPAPPNPSVSTASSPVPSTTARVCPRPYCSNCGFAPISVEDSRIVNGTDASEGEYPYQVDVGGFCGGSLITERWVLTAAHCFDGSSITPSQLVLGLGYLNTNNPSTGVLDITAKTIILHEDFNANTFENDVAVIELSTAVTFTDKIKPVCLPLPEDIPFGGKAVATGWGDRMFGAQDYPDILQEVELDIIDDNACSPFGNTTTAICALTPYKDACQGDSGGPLVAKVCDSKWVVIGIVSYGVGCATPGFPGVYARVPNYVDWISSKIGTPTCT